MSELNPPNYLPGQHPSLPPPRSETGLLHWLRSRLFSNWHNSLLTLLAIWGLYASVPALVEWGVTNATISGSDRSVCEAHRQTIAEQQGVAVTDISGACWTFIKTRFPQFMYGFYPESERWRVNTAGLLLVAVMVPLFIKKVRRKGLIAGMALVGYPLLAYVLLYGGVFGLSVVETSSWGGLMLTLVISLVGIIGSLPIGILLALGRRSKMPAIRSICVVFIELWRGVPLITVLFMASVMLPLFLPDGINFDKLLRCLLGVMLFSAAYMAEVVRGGLQAIPKGQYEAAQTLGLSYWKMMGLIILPQALKLVIPGIVNTFIGLFKDTTLVLIIGLYDFLGIVQAAAQHRDWLGFAVEAYVFSALVYWIFCFSMSRYSMHLEKKLHTGH